MDDSEKIIECVPNFSEGRDLDKIEKIVNPFRGKNGVKLLDYKGDKDHNRLVVTVVGEPEAVKDAIIEAIGVATQVIDLRVHKGQHPRMGACDVVPYIPIKNVSIDEAIKLANDTARQVSKVYNLPIFLYEKAATSPERENLANIRKGEFEGMPQKMQLPNWTPDYGSAKIHPSAGVTAIGVRMPLIAFNVNLDTSDLQIASNIAKNVRFIGGGLRYCKALGVELKERAIVQVSMNMTDFTKTALYSAYELVKIEARRYGVNIVGTQIIGLLPMQALLDTAVYYLGIENFSMDQILETRLME